MCLNGLLIQKGKELLHLFSIDCEKVTPQIVDGIFAQNWLFIYIFNI